MWVYDIPIINQSRVVCVYVLVFVCVSITLSRVVCVYVLVFVWVCCSPGPVEDVPR